MDDNRTDRTVEGVAATEAPVAMDTPEWGVVPEILLMSGCKLPPGRRVPLLGDHDHSNVMSVLGSATLTIDGDKLLARCTFASSRAVPEVWELVRDKHLTDLSVGYIIDEAQMVFEGESAFIDGRQFEGPVHVVTSWKVRELAPICDACMKR
jgi:hypothetical protein